ncbi:hypothetical protein ACFW2V_13690 [Streptomyces sp. NPDC058947]|uniref:hypothetical protein n=1 Tax=Streptomyces sp. NPDC058947 TaxID=3346675 RepID=UPI00369E65C1
MQADEFPVLLRELTIPGATVGPVVNDKGEPAKPGSGLQYGFRVVGKHGACIIWQVALQGDGAQASGSAVFPAAVPAQPDKLVTADVEASIAAWIGQSEAAGHVVNLKRYSQASPVSGLRYGLALTLDTGGRVFIQPLWTLETNERPTKDNKCKIRDVV